MRIHPAFWVLTSAALAFGCGSADETAGTQPGSPVCPALAQAWCAKAEACNTFVFQVDYGSAANCLALKTIECRQQTRGEGLTLTDAHVQACADAMGGVACAGDELELPAECDWPAGTLGAKAPCTSNYQCLSGRCPGGGSYCGECTDPVLRAEGEPCDVFEGINCAAGSFCSMTDDICKKLQPKGSACELGGCEAPNQCVQDKCDELRTIGEPCTSLFDCGDGTCNTESGKCEQVTIAKEGEACWIQHGSFGMCLGGLECEMDKSYSGTCKRIGGPGEPCTTSNSWALSLCMEGLTCQGGKCVERPVEVCD